MKHLITACLIFAFACLISAQSPPTINVCAGDQTICLHDTIHQLCVKITVEAGLSAIDHFTIDWGDNTLLTTVPGSNNPAQQLHTYNLKGFYNKCDFEEKFVIELLTYFVGEPNSPKNNSFILRFRNPPIPNFTYSGKTCANENIQFTDMSCTNAQGLTVTYFWDFGNGQTSSLAAPSTAYPAPGNYPVRLCVKNACDSVCITKQITILDKPQVNTVSFTSMPSSGCMPLQIKCKATVQQVYQYAWSVLPASCPGCYQFIPATGQDSLEPVIRFLKEGTYQVLLTGKNPCGEDTMSTVVQVFALPQITLTGNPVGCKSLSYTPDVDYLNPNPGSITSYQWTFPKGNPTTSNLPNPVNIQYTNNGDTLLTDLITLTVTGPCGTQTFSLTVKVYGDTEVNFGPLGTICRSADPFTIPVLPAPPAGIFTSNLPPAAFNLVTGLLNPASVAAGTYNLTYTVNIPGATNCSSQKSISFEIRDSTPVALTVPARLCIDAVPITLQASPPGGVWTSQGALDSLSGQYSAAQAQAGPDGISYAYEDPVSHCISAVFKTIEVVALPLISHDPIIFACKTGQPINLGTEGNFAFTPSGPAPQTTWSGPGVNPATSQYMPNTVGLFNFSVTYSIDPQCATQAPFQVQVDSFIAAAAPGALALCASQNTYTLTGLPAGGTWSGGPNINPNTGEINLAATIPGPYNYVYTIKSGTLCESSATTPVTIVSGDGVSLPINLDYICETATTYTLPAAAPANGVWTGPQLSNGNLVNISLLQPDTFVYTYTAVNLPDACNKVEFRLIVAPQPSADFSLDPDTACVGNTVSVIPVPAGLLSQVSWGDNAVGTSLSHQYSQAGDFPVLFTVFTLHPLTGLPLCTNSAGQSVHIVAPPEKLAFASDQDSGCAVLQVTFTNLSIAENGQFRWDFGNGQPIFAGFQPVAPIAYPQGTEDTTYIVRLTVLTGCDSLNFLDTITVFPQPQAGFGITYDQPCSGGILQLNNTSTGNPISNQWQISNPAQAFTTFNPPLLQFFTDSLPRLVNITLITSNVCGADTTQQTITVNPADIIAFINISDTTGVCVGDTVTLTSFSTPGAPIHWQTTQGNTFLGSPLQLTFNQAGIFKVTLFAEGCGFDSMNVWVHVQPAPDLQVQHPAILCPGDPANFLVQTSAPGSLLYFGDGDSTNLQMVEHRYDQAGTYPLQAVATSLVGCRATWNGNLEIAPKPTALLQAPDSVCSGREVLFLSLSGNNLTCLWSFGDSTTEDACTTNHNYAQGGLYNVALTVVSVIGCRDTVFAPVYVRTTPSAIPAYQILEPCSPALVSFTSQSIGATGLQWTLGDGSTAQDPALQHTYAFGGQYAIQLIATNEGFCADTGFTTVQLFQSPLFDLERKENCLVAAGTDLRIYTPSGNVATVTGPNYQRDGDLHPGLTAGFYDIHIVSPEGCPNDTTVYIAKPSELLLQVSEDSFDISLGESVVLDAVVNKLAVLFQWSPGLGLDSDTIAQPVATPLRTVQYLVRATDSNGCFKTDTVFIKVRVDRDAGVYIPDVFTPNGDGANDVFYVRSIHPGLAKIEQFRILDKYGEIMFDLPETLPEQPAFGWDGTFKTEKAEAGLYRYQLVLVYTDQERVIKTGYLLLAR